MCAKWTRNNSESGILRKSEFKEKKEELFVFGYSCKLFRDDEKALHIDQGKHLIPWMGDETLKIDRYDARGALHDLSTLEAPPGGFDWRVELTRNELDVEQLCDEERYRAMHTDEDEEQMYKEEELKRLHAAGYGQVGFNYEAPAEPAPVAPIVEADEEPFIASPALKALLPVDVVLPDTEKLNAIIDKTAKFIATQGAQMEILLRAKQKDNTQFQFLNKESPLHAYYIALSTLVKAGKWPEKVQDLQPDKHPENDDYLHPSLGSTVIESAPSIPSIHYRPSADCDYTMLISKIRGEATLDAPYEPSLADGEVPPPGTQPLLLPERTNPGQICRPPVMYMTDSSDPEQRAQQTYYEQYAAYYEQYMAQARAAAFLAQEDKVTQPPPVESTIPKVEVKPAAVIAPSKSTGLSLMKNYDTDSDSDASDFDDTSSNDSKEKAKAPPIATPPDDVQVVIDKMAAYVARNGDEFAEIVRAKNDPRFTFLEPDNQYHPWYLKLMIEKRGVENGGKNKDKKDKKAIAPVSFSIKKLKEPDPVLPKPALPYESSSDEESETKQTETKTENAQTQESTPKATPPATVQIKVPPVLTTPNIPVAVVYKIDAQTNPSNNVVEKPVLKPVPEKVEAKVDGKVEVANTILSVENTDTVREKPCVTPKVDKTEQVRKERSLTPERKKEKEDTRPEKKYKEEYRSKSESRDYKRSADRDKKRYKESERVKKRRKYSKEELEGEIISLEDNSEELIDLTGDQPDSKEGDSESEKAKQMERRRRAAEFLKKVGVDPSAAALPTSSLASAMVDTLESIRKKKALEEEKRRKREKRRHRDYNGDREHKKSRRRRHGDDDESDYESSKKKKRKKDKKHSSSKNKKKKRRPVEVEEEKEEIADQPLSIDLKGTLKELRTSSPTKDLCFQSLEDNTRQTDSSKNSSESEDVEKAEVKQVKKKKKKKRKKKQKEEREYSEGEWSSDSEEDSQSTLDSD